MNGDLEALPGVEPGSAANDAAALTLSYESHRLWYRADTRLMQAVRRIKVTLRDQLKPSFDLCLANDLVVLSTYPVLFHYDLPIGPPA